MRMPLLILLALVPTFSFTIGGCRSPQTEARQALVRELEDRQQRRERALQLYERGLEAHDAGDLDQAQQHLHSAVGIDDRFARAWLALGVAEYERGKLFDAAQAFDKAATLRPERYEPHFNLGIVMESAGKYTTAIEAYQRALRLAPDQIQVMENLARIYIRVDQNREETRQLINRALREEQRPEWRDWLQQQQSRFTESETLPQLMD